MMGNWKMKQLVLAGVLLGFAGLVTLAPATAGAIDFKIRGHWIFAANYGQNGNFTNRGHTGYDFTDDDFEMRERVLLQLDAVASERLSGNVAVEIGKFIWGKASGAQSGGALGADSSSLIKVKRAFLDWSPVDELKLRMGIQYIASPHFALDGPTVLSADVAGISANWEINDNVKLTGFWIRPFNDNYVAVDGRDDSGYLDNMDMGGLMVPLRFKGWAMTPWALYGAMGPNTLRTERGQFSNHWKMPESEWFFSGIFPLMADEKGIRKNEASTYANMWWGGLAGELTFWEPLRVAWEFTWGSVSWADAGYLDRQGWLGALLVEYALDWGTPGIFGWYGSGDDDNLGNGSERLPVIANDAVVSGFSDTYAGSCIFGLERERTMVNTMVGTWGVGARIKNLSFLKNLRHTIHVSLWGGTNDSGILEKLHQRTGAWMSPNVTSPSGPAMGRDPLYLTDKDYAVEMGLLNSWKIQDNLIFNLEASYIHLMLDRSDSVWGLATTGGGQRELRDAWNVCALLMYAF